MIVCLCKGITDADVRRVIADGASSLTEIGARSGAGTECGGCRPVLYRLLVEHRQAASAAGAQIVDQDPRRTPPTNCNPGARQLP